MPPFASADSSTTAAVKWESRVLTAAMYVIVAALAGGTTFASADHSFTAEYDN